MSRAGGELPGGEDPELFREMDRVFTQPMSLQRNMFLRAKAYEDQLYPGPSFFHTRDERKLMRKVRKEAFFEMREKYAKLLRGGDSNGFASGPAAVFGSAAQRPLDPAQSDRITFPAPDSYGRLQAGGVVASRGVGFVCIVNWIFLCYLSSSDLISACIDSISPHSISLDLRWLTPHLIPSHYHLGLVRHDPLTGWKVGRGCGRGNCFAGWSSYPRCVVDVGAKRRFN